MKYFYTIKLSKLRHKTGIDLEPNVAGAGLHIPHGKIVVNPHSIIGSGCKILSDVTIGAQGRYDKSGVPIIGNNVFIGSGARIIGDITIADDCVIGANAVVVDSITENGVTVAGIPAKIVSHTDSFHYLNRD